MKTRAQLKDIAAFSKGMQINGDDLIENGTYDYLNGGIAPSGKWNDYNTPGGTVTISEGGNSCGYVNYMREPFWCGAHCYYLFNTLNNSEYLYYLLKSQQNRLMGIRKGACMPNIKKADLGKFKIVYDTDEEQQDLVVSILKKAEKIVTIRQQELKMLDDLIKSRFVEMFGDPELNPMEWPVEALGDVLSVEPQNGLYKPQSDYVQDGTGIPILRIDAYYDGKVTDFSGLKRLNCTDTERSRYLLMENDVVINRVNSLEYLGKCAWITGLIEPTVFESNMMRFHVDESRIDPCYMTRLLCSTFIYKQILNRAKKAVNQASINQGDVQSFKILVPPVGLQKQYAAFVAQVDKSKAAVQKALDEAQLPFDSLMQKYFG